MEAEARFHSSLNLEDLSAVDLVVEAVYEDMALKQGEAVEGGRGNVAIGVQWTHQIPD